MKKKTQKELLQELDRLLRRLSEIVDRDFASLSPQQFNWKPSPKSWSIGECLDHLNIISAYYVGPLEQLLKKGRKAKKPKAEYYKAGILGRRFVQSVQLNEDNQLGLKMKSPKAYRPSQSQYLPASIIQPYLAYQEQFRDFLADAQALDINRYKLGIAILPLIKLRLGDMLRFLIYHNERHIVQAQRVQHQAAFPH